MASEDGNEGKDFALEEKQKEQFERAVMETIKNEETKAFVYNDFMYDVIRDEEDNSIAIKASSNMTVVVIKEGKLNYNINNLEEFQKILNSKNNSTGMGYKDSGLPDIEYLKYLEKENKKDKDNDENEENREENLDNPEKLDEEPEELAEEEEIDENKDKTNNKSEKLVRKSDWIKVNADVLITKNKSLRDLLQVKDGDIYIAPTQDYSTFKIINETKDGNRKELDCVEQTEGKNPRQDITTLDSENRANINEEQPNMMLKIKGKGNEGVSISRGDMGEISLEYWRKPYSDMYMSTPVPVVGRDGEHDKISPDTKYYMSQEYTSSRELEGICENSKKLEEINKQELPDSIDPTVDGIQFEELDIIKFKEQMKEKIINQLNDENYGYPASRDKIAGEMVNLIVDEGMNYEESKETIDKGEKKQGGITPGDNNTRENGII